MNLKKETTKKNKGFYLVLSTCFLIVFACGLLLTKYSSTYPSTEPEPVANPSVASNPMVSETETPSAPETVEIIVPEEPQETMPVLAPQKPERLTMPLDGEIIVGYAKDHLLYSKTLEDWRTHIGIDIAGKAGSVVKASATGTVEDIYQDPLLGTTVVLLHGEQIRTLYQNLEESVAVSLGNTVQAGDTIGTVGISALSESADEPHLHFGVTENHTPLNPMDWLEK